MPESKDRIRLVGIAPAREVEFDKVYFAFASGRLKYDCATCKAQCCRGHGYMVQIGHELQEQVDARPDMRFFVELGRVGAIKSYHVRNCPPACFFLNDTGHCDIHVKSGYAAKPETCRLFPFNDLCRVGQALIVRPHRHLCPLQIVPPGDTSSCSYHTQLLSDMSDKPIVANVPELVAVGLDPEQFLTLERKVLRLAEDQLDERRYSNFAMSQVIAHRSMGGAIASAEGFCGDRGDELRSFLRTLAVVLGSSEEQIDPSDAALVQTSIGMAPFLRTCLLLKEPSAAGPRSAVSPDRVPFYLAGLHALAALAKSAGMAHVTFQTVSRLMHSHDALLQLLAHVDTVMVLSRGSVIDLSVRDEDAFQKPFLRIARALLPDTQKTANAKLAEVINGNSQFDGLERVMFLKTLARHLKGRIERQSGGRRETKSVFPIRARIQHWALGNLDERILAAACKRVARRKPNVHPTRAILSREPARRSG